MDAAANSHSSPSHAGELAVQRRLGIEQRMQKIGTRVIRQFMPDQHRQFYEQLPMVFVGGRSGTRRGG
jgi:predicted pyridoxine 5'-phosphate oxidase superfamily flavin-nucleotide-binding protein